LNWIEPVQDMDEHRNGTPHSIKNTEFIHSLHRINFNCYKMLCMRDLVNCIFIEPMLHMSKREH
jgi:hypothetical protein